MGGAAQRNAFQVYAWHRVGHMLEVLVLRLFKARFVDDCFGASKVGVRFTGGVILSFLATLLGFPTDPDKDSDLCLRVVGLGALFVAAISRRVLKTRVVLGVTQGYV